MIHFDPITGEYRDADGNVVSREEFIASGAATQFRKDVEAGVREFQPRPLRPGESVAAVLFEGKPDSRSAETQRAADRIIAEANERHRRERTPDSIRGLLRADRVARERVLHVTVGTSVDFPNGAEIRLPDGRLIGRVTGPNTIGVVDSSTIEQIESGELQSLSGEFSFRETFNLGPAKPLRGSLAELFGLPGPRRPPPEGSVKPGSVGLKRPVRPRLTRRVARGLLGLVPHLDASVLLSGRGKATSDLRAAVDYLSLLARWFRYKSG